MYQQTLALVKPDAVMKRIEEEIKERYWAAGLFIVREHRLTMDEHMARQFYKEHEGRHYFEGLFLSMMSAPCIALILEGPDAIVTVRRLNGKTKPEEWEPGTIRYDFKSAGGPFNIVHASDSEESAKREIDLIFGAPR